MHLLNTYYVLSNTLATACNGPGDTKTKNYKTPSPVHGRCVGKVRLCEPTTKAKA